MKKYYQCTWRVERVAHSSPLYNQNVIDEHPVLHTRELNKKYSYGVENPHGEHYYLVFWKEVDKKLFDLLEDNAGEF